MSKKKPTLESLFEAAVAIESADQRAAFVQEKCGDNQELREQLEKMLASDADAGSFLEKPPEELDRTLLTDSAAENRAASLEAGLASAFSEGEAVVMGDAGHSVLKSLGQTIDLPQVVLRDEQSRDEDPIERPDSPEIPDREAGSRYQFQGEIARGGMGAILKGRDTDLGRDLAIKVLLDSHKDKPEVIERFVEEAQIGGQLQHPGIAPVYELGQFADRRPFFSMKLVKGKTLAKLLADRKDPSHDRAKFIGIFEQICQTLAYAHSRGVIHRDLKPANIMVGAFGEVQVMDWGLAKVLSTGGVADEKKSQRKQKDASIVQTRRSTGSDVPGSVGSETQMGSVMGTPAYMPPEQAQGKIENLNQRADVFGLGAILCEILTGWPPYVGDDGTAVYGLACRGELEDAFSRLEACGADAELIALARDCLAAERTDRPRDAGVLAARVTAYLESVESKLRETELQRASEAARVVEQKKRFRITLALAATVLLALVGGIVGTSWQAQQAKLARDDEAKRAEGERLAKLDARASQKKAEEAAEKEQAANAQAQKRLAQIEKTNDILASIFVNLDPKEIAREERPLQAILVEKLDKAVAELEGESIGDPLVVAEMQVQFAYSLLGLGEPGKAIILLEKARDTRADRLGPEDPNTLNSMGSLALAYKTDGQLDKALPLMEKTLRIMRARLGSEHPDALAVMNNLAVAYQAAGQLNKALPLYEETLKIEKAKHGSQHAETIENMHNLAFAYHAAGQLNKALPLYEETLKIEKAKLGPKHPTTLGTMNNLAGAYRDDGRLDKSLSLYEETVKLRKVVLGPDHRDTLVSMSQLAGTYGFVGQGDKALPMLEETFRLMRDRLGHEHPDTLTTMARLAVSYQDADQLQEALTLLEQTLKLQRASLGPEHPDTLVTMGNLGGCYGDAGQLEKGLPLLKEALKLMRARLGPDHPKTLTSMNNLASAYVAAGKLELALPLFEETLKTEKEKLGSDHPNALISQKNLAVTYWRTGQTEKALSLLRERLDQQRASLGPEHPDTLQGMFELASLYLAAGRIPDARTLAKELSDVARTSLPDGSPQLAAQLELCGGILLKCQAHIETEPLLRQCLAIREEHLPNSWLIFHTRSLLGGALLGQKKYAEAEPMLMKGYEEMKAREQTIPPQGKIRLTESLQRLVQLYQATGKKEEAAKWQAELAKRQAAAKAKPAAAKGILNR